MRARTQRELFAGLTSGLLASLAITMTLASPAQAAPDARRCDPDRPRGDVYVCASVWSHRQRDGHGRVMDALNVRSSGDNSELEDCPATTVTAVLWRPLSIRPAWFVTDFPLCQSGDYSHTFRGVKGIRVPGRAHFQISYRQHLNFDTDEFGDFGIGVR